MMLASPYYPQHIYTYTPPRPSPLSERSANAVPRLFNFTMASQPTGQSEKKTPMSQRAYKPNPLIQTRDGATQRRRNLFFRRVQQDRDDKKWEARGEQIQRLDFISEKKRWEAEKAREAPSDDAHIDDAMLDEAISSQTPINEQEEPQMTEADYILAQEEYELQDLVSSMEDVADTASQHYGSDDEDYDQLFMEYANATETHQPSQIISNWDPVEDMDMSEG